MNSIIFAKIFSKKMFLILKNFLQKTLSILLLFAIMLPFALKLEHIFENHHHTICLSKVESHIHQLNDNCDFLNYNISSANSATNMVFKTIVETLFAEKNNTITTPFTSSEKGTAFLRGPPSLV
jgi:hypothetical protein